MSGQGGNKIALAGVLAVLVFAAPVYAIQGDTLPESELPSGVCRIVVGSLVQKFEATTRSRTLIKELPPVIFEERDHLACSSDLITPDTLLTAAHCYQGNNEWKIRRGYLPYPVLDRSGRRLKGCEGSDYIDKPECISHRQYGIIRTIWNGVRVECPREDGKGFEVRPLALERGYSNPFFRDGSESQYTRSISIRNFDVAVYKLEQPILTSRPLPVAWRFSEIVSAIGTDDIDNPNPFASVDACRSFGYGIGNDGKTGTLRGANTPVTRFAPSFILTELEVDPFSTSSRIMDRRMPNTGWVMPGDSGGALLCRGKKDRSYKLFGIVSRSINRSILEKRLQDGGMEPDSLNAGDMSDFTNLIAKSTYALPSFHKFFYDHVLEKGAFPRPLDTKWWYAFFYPYEKGVIEHEIADTRACLKRRSNEMDREARRAYSKTLEVNASKVRVTARQMQASPTDEYDEGWFLSEMQISGTFDKIRDLHWNCRGGVFFKDH